MTTLINIIFNKGVVLALIIAMLAWASVSNVDIQGYRDKSAQAIAQLDRIEQGAE